MSSRNTSVLKDTYIYEPIPFVRAAEYQGRQLKWRNMIPALGATREGVLKSTRFENRLKIELAKKGITDPAQVQQVIDSKRYTNGVSIFNPCLAEREYLMYTNEWDSILDPFAGDLVRGFVAGKMKRYYTGIELRGEQVESNMKGLGAPHLRTIAEPVRYQCGDALRELELLQPVYDFVFTCPPYWNLERYSKQDADLSACKSYDQFMELLVRILEKSYRLLKPDRCMTVVLGNIRDKRGVILNMIGDLVRGLAALGVQLYNNSYYMPYAIGYQFTAHQVVARNMRMNCSAPQQLLTFYKPSESPTDRNLQHLKKDRFIDYLK